MTKHRSGKKSRKKYWLGPFLAIIVVIGIVLLASGRLRWSCPFVARRDRPLEAGCDPSPAFPPNPLLVQETDRPVDEGDDVVQLRGRSANLADIEGIGPAYAEKLKAQSLRTTNDLLQAGANPSGRAELAAATDISGKLILRWVNQADLLRIRGVGGEYAELLEAAGVDTVAELAQRRSDNLRRRLVEVNDEKKLVRRVPTEAQVVSWIEAAKALPRVVRY